MPDLAPGVSLVREGLSAFAAGVLFALGVAGMNAVLGRVRLSPGTWRDVLGIAEKVVMAVEQLHGSLDGPERRRRAEEMLLRILGSMGIRVPPSVVEAALESSVLLLESVVPVSGTSPSGASPACERKEEPS